MRIFCAACAVVLAGARPSRAQQLPVPPAAPQGASSSLTIFLRGVPIGTELSSVTRTADGWTISGTGRLGAPLDVVLRRLQVRYTPDWKPIELMADGAVRGEPQALHTTVTDTTVTTRVTTGSQPPVEKTDTIAPDALLLPNAAFSPFEALAARLHAAEPGSTLHAYQPPNVALEIRVGESAPEQIQTAGATLSARRTHIALVPPGMPPLDGDVWSDSTGRLLRLSIPAQSIEVVREDIASVAARRITVSRPNDEPVKVPANGFVLAGTLSKPFDAPARPLAAVVLVGGSGATDRDETVYGIPIFGQLAAALADAGFAVLRYDKRGVGQSGGRAEAATLADYAEDARAAVKFLAGRKDIDPKHIALVGHSEGGSVAMLVAASDKRLAGLVLLDAMGVTGADLNLDQVTHQLERSTRTEEQKQATIDLQKKIQQAVLTGKGWEGIPNNLRGQADTPWFQSFLSFDPAKVMPDIRQPILIVQGMLDTQVPPANADRLEAFARARKNGGAVEVVKVPGLNHLLVNATTGEVDEYASLKEKHISPAVTSAVAAWLQKTFGAPVK